MEEYKKDKEVEIIEDCKSGNTQTFASLIVKYEKEIYLLCFRLTQNEDESKELCQKTFYYAFKNIKQFNLHSKFSTWLTRICINLWTNDVKRRNKIYFFSLEKEIETENGSISQFILEDKSLSIEKQMQENEIYEKVRKAFKKLKPKEKVILILRDIEEKTYEEIGKVLKCGPGTVASRISRAREKLKKYFELFEKGEKQQ